MYVHFIRLFIIFFWEKNERLSPYGLFYKRKKESVTVTYADSRIISKMAVKCKTMNVLSIRLTLFLIIINLCHENYSQF